MGFDLTHVNEPVPGETDAPASGGLLARRERYDRLMNRVWHDTHPMPKPASLAQRIEWHLAHAKHCGCRPIPAGVLAQMTASGIPLPDHKKAS